MTSVDIPVGIWCWPGPNAAAGVQEGPTGPVLAVFLDPVNLVLTTPPFPAGALLMSRFLRELARAATAMANELDPVTVPHREGGAHRVRPDRPSGEAGERR